MSLHWLAAAPNTAHVADRLGRMGAAAVLLASAACLGVWVARVTWDGLPRAGTPRSNWAGFLRSTTRAERLAVCLLCGVAVLTGLAVALCAAGFLYADLLRALIGLAIPLGAAELARTLHPAGPSAAPTPGLRGLRLWQDAIVALVCLAALPPIWSPLLGYDSLVYHLALPQRYLEVHGFVALPYNVFANAPHNTELFYTFGLSVGDATTIKTLHAGFGLAMLALTAGLARRTVGPLAAPVAVVLTLASPVMLDQWGTSYTDLAIGFSMTGALWGLWIWSRTADPGMLRFSALALGFFAGTKYVSLFGVGATAVVAVAVLWRRRTATRGWVAVIAPYAIGVLLGAGPWLLKNALVMGNPIYPVAPALLGYGSVTPTHVGRLARAASLHGMGHALGDLLRLPWRLTVLGGYGSTNFDGVITPLWLMALPFVLIRPRAWPSAIKFLGLFAGVYAVLWALSIHIARYLVPAFPAFSILTAYGALRWLGDGSAGRGRTYGAIAGGLCATAVWWLPPILARALFAWTTVGPVAWGVVPAHELRWREEQTAPTYAYIRQHLPAEARLIGLWEGREWEVPRALDGDTVLWAPRWLDRFAATDDLAGLAAELRAEGYTHVLFNRAYASAFQPLTGSAEEAREVERGLANITVFLERHCIERFADRGLHLYEIQPSD